jgi:hypothetical protein
VSFLHVTVFCSKTDRICSTLEENIEQYAWSYTPFPIKNPVTGDVVTHLPYPPHAVFDKLPESEQKQMTDIFDPKLVETVQGIVGGKGDLYFRLPYKEDLQGDWTLKQLAEANRQCYLDYKKKCLEDPAYQNDLNPLLTWNIGEFYLHHHHVSPY